MTRRPRWLRRYQERLMLNAIAGFQDLPHDLRIGLMQRAPLLYFSLSASERVHQERR